MQHSTGSVYLDTPSRPSRRPAPSRVGVSRAAIAAVLTVVGLLGLSAAIALSALRAVLVEPQPVTDAFDHTLQDPIARAELQTELAAAIEHGFVGDDLAEAASFYGLDVEAEAQRLSVVILDDPGFRARFYELVVALHERSLIDPGGDDIDLAPVSQAALDVIRRESPALHGIIPDDPALWTLDADRIPDFTAVLDVLDRSRLAAMAAAIATPLALALHPRRHRVVAWVGWWALTVALAGGVAAVGLPYLGAHLTGWTAVEVGVRSASLRLIGPAAIAGLCGVGLVAYGALAGRQGSAKVSQEGAAAALGVDEPPQWRQPESPALDLAARGLVDADHPLTNI